VAVLGFSLQQLAAVLFGEQKKMMNVILDKEISFSFCPF
jgi:hypothetical protein